MSLARKHASRNFLGPERDHASPVVGMANRGGGRIPRGPRDPRWWKKYHF